LTVNVEFVSSGRMSPLYVHWYCKEVPVAATENIALSPAETTWLTGDRVMVGGVSLANAERPLRTWAAIRTLIFVIIHNLIVRIRDENRPTLVTSVLRAPIR
jgi:hypothetical protein